MDAKQDVWRAIPALMGDGNGTIEVPNQQNMVYIRVGDGDLGQAFNNRCQLRDNLAVYVGYDPITDPDRRIFQVLSVRMADYAGAGNVTVPNVGPHHTTHEFGGGDDVYIEWRRLMGLRVGRPAAFVVTVDPGYIYRAGWIAIPSTNVNLTATHTALVGVQAQYVLISLSSTGVVTATAGTVVLSPALLTIADVPTPPAGHIPLAAVRLYKMQTAIGDTPAAPDIIDLRFPTYGTTSTALYFTAVTKVADYVATISDNVIVCNRATAMTITLPVATASGKILWIKSIGVGAVTVDGNGGDTIDGSATQTLNQWDAIAICDYAANAWVVI